MDRPKRPLKKAATQKEGTTSKGLQDQDRVTHLLCF